MIIIVIVVIFLDVGQKISKVVQPRNGGGPPRPWMGELMIRISLMPFSTTEYFTPSS